MRKSKLLIMCRPHPIKAFIDRMTMKFMAWLENVVLYLSNTKLFSRFIKQHTETHHTRENKTGILDLGTVQDRYMCWSVSGVTEVHTIDKAFYFTIFNQGKFFLHEYCDIEEQVRCKMRLEDLLIKVNGREKHLHHINSPEVIINNHLEVSMYDGHTEARRPNVQLCTADLGQVYNYQFTVPLNLGTAVNNMFSEEELIKQTVKGIRDKMSGNYDLYLEVFDKCILTKVDWVRPMPK